MNEQIPAPEHESPEYDAPEHETRQHESRQHETLEPQPAESWRHPINVSHLVMGIAFAGLVGVWALITSDAVDDEAIRWLLPIPWVVAGALGLAAATWSNLRARRLGHPA